MLVSQPDPVWGGPLGVQILPGAGVLVPLVRQGSSRTAGGESVLPVHALGLPPFALLPLNSAVSSSRPKVA